MPEAAVPKPSPDPAAEAVAGGVPFGPALADAVLGGDRRALAKAITLVESTRDDHRAEAEILLDKLLPHAGRSLRLGVTGTPGVGKSTFINRLGTDLVTDGRRLAVLAVDPSSRTTGGSILGDKTRMAELTGRDNVFIRPSPSAGISGGVAIRTRDAITVCEAAGFDTIIVETVGVGQSETAVAGLTDLFLLLVGPGGGDDLQGIKRGVMELADLVAINKADGDMTELAARTAADYRAALHLVRPKRPGFETAVVTCSSLTGDGLDDLWRTLVELHRRLRAEGELDRLRNRQAVEQLDTELRALLYAQVGRRPGFRRIHDEIRAEVADGRLSVSAAARHLVAAAFDGRDLDDTRRSGPT
ncbi:MAG: methylmalonyl Co-A mutase-associated GTPase MeaB [Acidimicrobiia bacterium]|nr:methylmalonyl Co-A mutase-associated GTPase MeaB [Acidimicrobiia bacterium]